jgi:excisionase family DNA binding protein
MTETTEVQRHTPHTGPTPLLVSPREAAGMLGVCEKTIYNLTKAGLLPAVRIGRAVRYSVETLRQWIKSQESLCFSTQTR